MKENFGSPFVLLDQKVIKPEITTKQEVKISNSITVTENDNPNHKNLKSPKDLSQDRKLRCVLCDIYIYRCVIFF